MKPLAQKPTKPIISTRNTPQTFTLNKLAKPIVRDDIFSLPPAVYGHYLFDADSAIWLFV